MTRTGESEDEGEMRKRVEGGRAPGVTGVEREGGEGSLDCVPLVDSFADVGSERRESKKQASQRRPGARARAPSTLTRRNGEIAAVRVGSDSADLAVKMGRAKG